MFVKPIIRLIQYYFSRILHLQILFSLSKYLCSNLEDDTKEYFKLYLFLFEFKLGSK